MTLPNMDKNSARYSRRHDPGTGTGGQDVPDSGIHGLSHLGNPRQSDERLGVSQSRLPRDHSAPRTTTTGRRALQTHTVIEDRADVSDRSDSEAEPTERRRRTVNQTALFPREDARHGNRHSTTQSDQYQIGSQSQPDDFEDLIARSPASHSIAWRKYFLAHPRMMDDKDTGRYYEKEAERCIKSGNRVRATSCIEVATMFELFGAAKKPEPHLRLIEGMIDKDSGAIDQYRKAFGRLSLQCNKKSGVTSSQASGRDVDKVTSSVQGMQITARSTNRHAEDGKSSLSTSLPVNVAGLRARTTSTASSNPPTIGGRNDTDNRHRHTGAQTSSGAYYSTVDPTRGNRHEASKAKSGNTGPDIRNPEIEEDKDPSIKGPGDGAADNERLDPRYKRRDPKRAGKFFSIGRVFAILDHQDHSEAKHDDSATNARWTQEIRLPNGMKTTVFSHIRRFAVVREGHGYCWAIPINTYNGQGCLKHGLNSDDIAAHAIIYSTDKAPRPLPRETGLTKNPIAIELGSSADELHRASRINFDQVRTLQHNVRAMDIGRVRSSSLPYFEAYWKQHLLR